MGVLGIFQAENEEIRFVRSLELAGKTIFDLGANLGYFTMYFCKAAGTTGRVYAFDPIPANCQAIREHLELNNLTNATVLQKAVGDQSGTVTFTFDPENTARASGNQQIGATIEQHTQAQSLTVEQVALDELVTSGELTPPDLVKIDVEGMEGHVLEGMGKLLREHKPDLYIEMHGANQEEKLAMAKRVCTLLWQAGYRIQHVERGLDLDSPAFEMAATGHLYCVAT